MPSPLEAAGFIPSQHGFPALCTNSSNLCHGSFGEICFPEALSPWPKATGHRPGHFSKAGLSAAVSAAGWEGGSGGNIQPTRQTQPHCFVFSFFPHTVTQFWAPSSFSCTEIPSPFRKNWPGLDITIHLRELGISQLPAQLFESSTIRAHKAAHGAKHC